MHANVVSYDLPGSGKSEGALSGNSSDNIGILDDILSWVRKNLNPSEIILWSRGMSTAIAVEFTKISTLSKLKSNGNSSPTSVVAESNHFINDDSLLPPKNVVSFLILDSPFTSVQDIFDTAITTAKDKGRKHVVLSPVFSSLSWMLRKAVGTKMNINLDSIRPIDNAVQNNTPCAILAARNDDFIPISHSKRFAEQWSGPVMLFEMDGSHFGYRSKEYTLMLIDAMRPYLKKSDPLVYTQVEKDENPKV